MNRRDHHCSPIAPRLLLALIPPSTRIGFGGGRCPPPPLPPPPPPPTQRGTRRPPSPPPRVRGQGQHGPQLVHGQFGQPAFAGADDLFGQGLFLLDHGVDP